MAALFTAGDLAAFRQSAAPPVAASMTPGSVALLANKGDAAAVEELRAALPAVTLFTDSGGNRLTPKRCR